MPLIKSGSKEAVSANIRAEKAAGKPQNQAVAIALSVARRARKRQTGGSLSDRLMNETLLPAEPQQRTENVQAHLDSPNLMVNTIQPDRSMSTWDRIKAGPSAADVIGLAGGPSQAIFLGPMARTADKAALALARQMAERNMPREQIRDATGWHQGKDQKWRYEISDKNAAFLPNAFKNKKDPKMSDVLDHPQLYEAHPELRDIAVRPMPADLKARGAVGGYDEPNLLFHPSGRVLLAPNKDPDQMKSVALHELQHAVQGREGFALGSAPKKSPELEQYKNNWLKMRENINNTLRRVEIEPLSALDAVRTFQEVGPEKLSRVHKIIIQKLEEADPAMVPRISGYLNLDKTIRAADRKLFENYQREAGEVESRNVQSRRNMTTAERKRQNPWDTEDVAEDLQTVSYKAGGGPVASSVARRMARPQSMHDRLKAVESNIEEKRNIPGLHAGEDSFHHYWQNPREDTNPLRPNREQELAKGGEIMKQTIKPQQQVPWVQRAATARLGFINSKVPGRTDKLNLNVPAGSYVVPSSVVSHLGQDNSMAGATVLDNMFSGPVGRTMSKRSNFRSGQARTKKPRMGFAEGGMAEEMEDGPPVPEMDMEMGLAPQPMMEEDDFESEEPEEVPVIAAGGEYVIPPDKLIDKFGDLDIAHKIMDQFVKDARKQHIKTLKKLPGPAKGNE